MSTTITVRPSDKQIGFYTRLVDERLDGDSKTDALAAIANMTKAQASSAISALMDMPRLAGTPGGVPMGKDQVVVESEGFFLLDGQMLKVRTSKSSGRLYAMLLVIPERPDGETAPLKGRWQYASGAIYRLSETDRLTREQAIAFGHDAGICFRCGIELDDPRSVAAGMGQTCAKKMGWAW